MARLTGPLSSLDATGTLAGFLTLERRGSKHYGYHKKRPRGFQRSLLAGFGRLPLGLSFFGYQGRVSLPLYSQQQGAREQIFSAGWPVYSALTPPEKASLSEEAQSLRISGANLFMRRWLESQLA